MPSKAKSKRKGVRGDGRFQSKLVIGVKPDGSPKYKFFYSYVSRDDAEKQKMEYVASHPFESTVGPAVSGDLTLSEWVERWLASYKSAVTANTRGQYKSIAKHICDYNYYGVKFGNMPIKSFLPIHLAEYMTKLAGMSTSTIGNNRIVLVSLFSTAYDNGLIERDITRKFPKVKGTYTGHRALERWEISLVSENYWRHRSGLGMMIMLWAGLRKGEAAALTWDDIDFDKNVIHVTKSLDYHHGNIKDPKTVNGVRDVPIFAKLREALQREPDKSGLLFTNVAGKLHTEQSLDRAIEGFSFTMERTLNGLPPKENEKCFRTDVWQKRFAEEGREWKTFTFTAHDLRTTFATMCYDAGVDIHTVKKWMGHASVETTLAIYTKLSNERHAESTQAMDAYSAAM